MIWLKRISIGIGALVVLALALLFGGSQWIIARHYAAPLTPLRVAPSASDATEGKRIAGIAQCRDCHGDAGKGRVLEESVMVGRLVAPGLARRAALYTDSELARLLRHGLKHDGTSLFVMPVQNFSHLSDADTARIIAWLRTLKPAPDDQTESIRYGPLARLALLGGGFKPSFVAALPRPTAERGRYLVEVACQQCHALHESQPSNSTDQMVPPLATVTAAYDLSAFKRLLHTGRAMSPRDLGAMGQAVKSGLYALDDREIAAIHAYLAGENAKTPAQ